MKGNKEVTRVDIEIDSNINLPKWVQDRIDRIYKLFVRKRKKATPNDILNFCAVTIASIRPYAKGKIACSTEQKGKTLHIYFTEEIKQERKYLQ